MESYPKSFSEFDGYCEIDFCQFKDIECFARFSPPFPEVLKGML